MTPSPVGKEGQTGLISPRDGQFIPLAPDQQRAAIAPAGDRLAVLVPAQQDGTFAIRIDQVPAPTAGAPDLGHAKQLTVQTAPLPVGDGPPPQLTDVAFLTERDGFGITHDGGIYRTADGGTAWSRLFQAEGAELSHIVPGAPPHDGGAASAALFVVGRHPKDNSPVLLSTIDNGSTWSVADPQGLSDDIRQWWPYLNFTFISPAVGFAVADADLASNGPPNVKVAMLATSDGGRHWAERPLPEGNSAAGGISFITADRGYITSFSKDGSQILTTADGGRTWQVSYTAKAATLYSLQFIDGRTGFAGGGNSPKYGMEPRQYLLRTQDGGATWQEAYRSAENTGFPIAALHFDSSTEGWAAIGVCTMGQSRPCGKGLAYTRDGGHTWQGGGQAAYGWSATGSSAWGVVGDPRPGLSLLKHSADGGATWGTLSHPSAVSVRGVHFTDARTGWLETNVGPYHTVDGGTTWQPGGESGPKVGLPPEEHGSANHMAFAGPADGWAAYTGKLYATHDGGATWERLSPGLTDYVSTMAFGDAQHGVAVSFRTLLFTADGGRTWSGQPLKGLTVAAADYRPDGHIWLAGAAPAQTLARGGSDARMGRLPPGGTRGRARIPDQLHETALLGPESLNKGRGVSHDGGASWQETWPQS